MHGRGVFAYVIAPVRPTHKAQCGHGHPPHEKVSADKVPF